MFEYKEIMAEVNERGVICYQGYTIIFKGINLVNLIKDSMNIYDLK